MGTWGSWVITAKCVITGEVLERWEGTGEPREVWARYWRLTRRYQGPEQVDLSRRESGFTNPILFASRGASGSWAWWTHDTPERSWWDYLDKEAEIVPERMVWVAGGTLLVPASWLRPLPA